jgi:hypothetical protein
MRYTYYQGIIKQKFSNTTLALMAMAFALALAVGTFSTASAGHNGADVEYNPGACGETTFNAGIIDPAGTHKVSNMYLVVSAEGNTQYKKIPTDGNTADITVGPFYSSTGDNVTVSWNVYGGGERDYDQPQWNGYGTPSFGSDINAYGVANGWGWILAGPEDPNPFVNWNEFEVQSCVPTKLHSVNGGGHILDGNGKRKTQNDISFGLGVTNYNTGTEGNATVRFHNTGADEIDKTTFHSEEITEFNYYSSDSPTCDAAVNFTAVGNWNGNEDYKVIVRAGDNDDSVRVTLYDSGGSMVYDSNTDYGNQSDCVGSARAALDNGNVVIKEY